MANYNNEVGAAQTIIKSSPPATEVRCYTYLAQHDSTTLGEGMAEATDGPRQIKTLQYTRRGLRMVGDPSLFDLDEPTWHPDEKVAY